MSMFEKGAVLARPFVKVQAQEPEPELSEKAFFESVSEDALLESIEKAATIGVRQDAAAACHQWVQGGDPAFGELDDILYGMTGADLDGETEMTDSQIGMYESLQAATSEFLIGVCGADQSDVELSADDEEAACRMFESANDTLGQVDSDEAIAEFAVREAMLLEATKKVVRDGKIVMIKTNRRKRRMTSAQKAALKKARAKSNTASARAARKKSARLRKKMGL